MAQKLYGYYAEAVLDNLYRQLNAINARQLEMLAAMRDAEAVDGDELWDYAAQVHDDLSDERADIRERIEELEGESE
jgi:hypothetical protein